MQQPDFFTKMLARGEKAERYVLQHVKRYDSKARKIKGYHKQYDIIAPTLQKTFEVKDCQDARVAVPIETHCTRRLSNIEPLPSGILTTTADYWVFYAKKMYLYVPTLALLQLLHYLPVKKHHTPTSKVVLRNCYISELNQLAIYKHE